MRPSCSKRSRPARSSISPRDARCRRWCSSVMTRKPGTETAAARQYPVWSAESRAHVARLLEEGVALGLSKHQPEIAAIEYAVADFFGAKHGLGTSTGNGALHAALIGLELTAGDEVMTSP